MSVHVRSLHIYPVKSCAGIALQESAIDRAGLHQDRRWVVMSNGKFLTQRQLPAMALIQPALTATHLHLHAPGMQPLAIALDGSELADHSEPVMVWRDTMPARSQGDAAARWFSDFLKLPCQLFKIDVAQAQRLADPQWVTPWLQTHAEMAAGTAAAFAPANPFGFADGFPVLVANQSSLDALNQQLAARGHGAVPMDRFRANIVLHGELPAYEEDHVALLRIGDVGIALVKPCTRCSIPDVDQATGKRHDEPGRTLRATRSFDAGVMFGVNGIVAAPPGAVLRVGEPVEVEIDF